MNPDIVWLLLMSLDFIFYVHCIVYDNKVLNSKYFNLKKLQFAQEKYSHTHICNVQ